MFGLVQRAEIFDGVFEALFELRRRIVVEQVALADGHARGDAMPVGVGAGRRAAIP